MAQSFEIGPFHFQTRPLRRVFLCPAPAGERFCESIPPLGQRYHPLKTHEDNHG